MITYTMEQGSPEWAAARLGIPTASQFHRICTPARMEFSAAASGYVAELLAEKLLGEPLSPLDPAAKWGNALAPGRFFRDFMERGGVLEAEAVAWYEMQKDTDVERVGFCTTDDGQVGGSPDGLVGDDGVIEIKCRGARAHIECLLGLEEPAKATQVQGYLWVTGRQWCDVLAYNPAFPPVLIRYGREPNMQKALDTYLPRFLAGLQKAEDELDRMGPEGRVDTDLANQLRRSLLQMGTEPDPDTMTLDEIGDFVTDLHDAKVAGVITDERETELRKAAIKGKWTEVRAAWLEIRKARMAVR